MVIYPYRIFVVITQFFFWIIFINNFYLCINWFTETIFFIIVYVI